MLESMSLLILWQASNFREVAFHDVRGRGAYQVLKLAEEYREPAEGGTRAHPRRRVNPSLQQAASGWSLRCQANQSSAAPRFLRPRHQLTDSLRHAAGDLPTEDEPPDRSHRALDRGSEGDSTSSSVRCIDPVLKA
jgi:hypothetical protein